MFVADTRRASIRVTQTRPKMMGYALRMDGISWQHCKPSLGAPKSNVMLERSRPGRREEVGGRLDAAVCAEFGDFDAPHNLLPRWNILYDDLSHLDTLVGRPRMYTVWTG